MRPRITCGNGNAFTGQLMAWHTPLQDGLLDVVRGQQRMGQIDERAGDDRRLRVCRPFRALVSISSEDFTDLQRKGVSPRTPVTHVVSPSTRLRASISPACSRRDLLDMEGLYRLRCAGRMSERICCVHFWAVQKWVRKRALEILNFRHKPLKK